MSLLRDSTDVLVRAMRKELSDDDPYEKSQNERGWGGSSHVRQAQFSRHGVLSCSIFQTIQKIKDMKQL